MAKSGPFGTPFRHYRRSEVHDFEWFTGNGNIATVTDEGLVEGINVGSVVTSVTAEGQLATCKHRSFWIEM